MLPGAAYTEKNATFVNFEGRPQRARVRATETGPALLFLNAHLFLDAHLASGTGRIVLLALCVMRKVRMWLMRR